MASSTRPPARRRPSGAWNRLRSSPSDPLDAYGLPSKGYTRLHDHKTQEAYYGKIVERYMKFCAAAGGGDELEEAFAAFSIRDPSVLPTSENTTRPGMKRPPQAQSSSSNESSNELGNILTAMRKLREGILGSRRRDGFAQRAYMFIIRASILAQSWESYQPALLHLLYQIHPHTPLSVPELQEFVGYYILDLACRQFDLNEAYSIRRAFNHRDWKVRKVLTCIVQDDWVHFWRLRRAVDGYQRAIMEAAAEGMRLHALKCIGRSYLHAEKTFIERSTDSTWAELVESGVGWQLQDNGNVVIRKPKSK